MSFFQRLSNWFSQSGREDNLLQQAVDLAKEKRPADAIAIYNDLLRSNSATSTVRARALFNRALAYSSLKDDERAVADLQSVISSNDAPENVRTAARTQLVRLKNRA
ncbi:tetratricopeptide repeat protein [Anatilimnocola sp. NA78]|uniref:tetratricopeptide repeat protein n=1 Tax=Anatilimnocola sp. NA78 TaxID=3415683 RepID=UPI003CE4C729